jgi:hypothetical protein
MEQIADRTLLFEYSADVDDASDIDVFFLCAKQRIYDEAKAADDYKSQPGQVRLVFVGRGPLGNADDPWR